MRRIGADHPFCDPPYPSDPPGISGTQATLSRFRRPSSPVMTEIIRKSPLFQVVKPPPQGSFQSPRTLQGREKTAKKYCEIMY
jgi:hypothetical protein